MSAIFAVNVVFLCLMVAFGWVSNVAVRLTDFEATAMDVAHYAVATIITVAFLAFVILVVEPGLGGIEPFFRFTDQTYVAYNAVRVIFLIAVFAEFFFAGRRGASAR